MNEEKLIKKSIFIQKIYAKRYDLARIRNIHIQTFMGNRNYELVENNYLKEEKIIFTCEIEMPLLERGDIFYINELNRTVLIKDRCRSSDNSIVYYLENKIVEDEYSHVNNVNVTEYKAELDILSKEIEETKTKNNEFSEDLNKIIHKNYELKTNLSILKNRINIVLSSTKTFVKNEIKEILSDF